jgi:phage terminase small subunit
VNIRQQHFAELVASGIPASRAYTDAGYSGRGKNAETNASRLRENEGVSRRIAELQEETRNLARLSKDDKLRILERLMISETEKASDRIAAIKIHNAMVGDNQPSKMIVEAPHLDLDAIRERAKHVVSGLNRYHGEPKPSSP